MSRRSVCPCGADRALAACCGRFLHGPEGQGAATPEELMRSRYTAYVLGDAPYLLRTWHRATRPAQIDPDPALTWTGLEVLAVSGGGPDDRRGTVEFRAHHVRRGRRGVLHEVSRFLRSEGRWLYYDGRIDDPA